jgi:hypothetical protein
MSSVVCLFWHTYHLFCLPNDGTMANQHFFLPMLVVHWYLPINAYRVDSPVENGLRILFKASKQDQFLKIG